MRNESIRKDRKIEMVIFFFISQIFFYIDLYNNELYIGQSVFTSIVYVLTLVHIAHFLLGSFVLRFSMGKIKKQQRDQEKQSTSASLDLSWINCIGIIWHYLALIWLFIFLFIFVV